MSHEGPSYGIENAYFEALLIGCPGYEHHNKSGHALHDAKTNENVVCISEHVHDDRRTHKSVKESKCLKKETNSPVKCVTNHKNSPDKELKPTCGCNEDGIP